MEGRIGIEDALIRGGDMGAIGNGWIDLGVGAFNLAGTYIPAYEVNNFFGRIRILGLALGGGNRGGLIGMTFRISGPFDNPQMEINPLSAICARHLPEDLRVRAGVGKCECVGVVGACRRAEPWMAGTSPAMTTDATGSRKTVAGA